MTMKRSTLEWGAPLVAVMAVLLAGGELIGLQAGDHIKIATYLAIALLSLLAPKIASISVGKDGLSADLREKVEENNQKIEKSKNVTIELDQQLTQKISQIFIELSELRQGRTFNTAEKNVVADKRSETPPSFPSGVEYANDPQKGRFGGQERNQGAVISAIVEPSDVGGGWQKVSLRVWADKASELSGFVEFFLHNTFQPDYYRIPVAKGEARLVLRAWGAFTVGALAGDKKIPLELDLATSGDITAPKEWRER